MAKRTLLLCNGSHCRKALRKDDRLARCLARLPVETIPVRCQKICRSPVVGVEIDGAWQWFERMDSRKAQKALAELLLDDRLPRPLRKRRNAKRAGQRR